ncbi:MAG: HAMP domain-containing sensor histidine kinase [Dehalococcoidia bacterium]
MATDSVPLPRSDSGAPRRWALPRPPRFTRGVQGRIYLTLGAIIVLTLVIAGVVFFFLLGGYQDRLAASTLREIGVPVYTSVVAPPAPGFGPFEVSRQLSGSPAADPNVRVLFVDSAGMVISEASENPRFRGEQLDIDLEQVGVGVENFVEGTLRTGDGSRLNYLAARLDPEASDRFSAEYIVLALPVEARQSVLGDLTPRLFLAGGLALVAAVIVGLFLARSIYRPLQATTAAARSVARGRFDHKVAVSGTREARELAESFNQMTDEVQRQQAALRDFLANVSHDLQTPLTSINGFSQALLDGTVEAGASQQNAYRIIEEESRRLLRLVEGLLDLSRMEAGQVEVNLAAVDVAELLRHIHTLFTLRADELDVRYDVLPIAVPDVWGDVDRLEQVLANLVDNALRHTPPGGNVVLSARRESDATVSISVADTGSGIAAEDLTHLFDRFYRPARSGSSGGTGLGLAIARELVRAQNGEIQVESRESVGTTFRVLLRIHHPRDQARHPRGFE